MRFKLPATVNIIGLFLILVLALIFFYPTFSAGFIFDDWGDLRNAYGSLENRLREFLPTNGDFRAVTRLFWWISYELFGTEPLGYHLLNFALHLLIIAMVWGLVRLLTNNDWIALCAAFLFSINKTTITPVSWVSASIDQKLLLFGLLAIFLYINTARMMAASGKYPVGRILIFTLVAWFAFKSKLMAWPLPAIYLLLDFTYCSEKQSLKERIIDSSKRWLKIVWPLLVLTIIYIPNFIAWMGGSVPTSGEYGISLNPLNFFASCGKYLASTFGLNGYYSSSDAWLSGAAGAALLLYGIFYRNRDILFGMLWFTITLLPVGLLRTHHFDHHLYLPLFGLVMAVAALLYDLTVRLKIPSRGPALAAIFGVLVCGYTYVMYPFFKEYSVTTRDVVKLSNRTLTQIHEIAPIIPKQVTFLVYPTPKWSLLNYSAPLNFLYQQFDGITTKVFDNQSDFESAIQASPSDTAWYALHYEPSDGSVILVSASAHFPANK